MTDKTLELPELAVQLFIEAKALRRLADRIYPIPLPWLGVRKAKNCTSKQGKSIERLGR